MQTKLEVLFTSETRMIKSVVRSLDKYSMYDIIKCSVIALGLKRET